MSNVCNRHNTQSSLSALEPLREAAPAARRGECPFLARVSRLFRSLRLRLTRTPAGRRPGQGAARLDDRTLNDIGLSRMDVLDWGPR
jgi:uncharacterized protein YjiS (DUF1127 family)